MVGVGGCVVSSDGIYSSPRPPLQLPPPHLPLDIATHLLNNTKGPAFAHKIAVVDALTAQSLTFSQLHLSVRCVAAGLHGMGVRRGHVVLILSPNSIHFPVIFLAVTSIGAILTTVNPLYTVSEISKQIKDSSTRLIFTVPALLSKVQGTGLPIVLIETRSENLHDKSAGLIAYRDLLSTNPGKAPQVAIRQTDTACLLYSSGTTGISKGVILSHRNVIAAATMVWIDNELHGVKDEIVLLKLPMFHVYGLAAVLYTNLQQGCTVVTMPKFELYPMLEAIQKYKVTFLPTVPPVCIALAKQPGIEKYDLKSLREILSGAAPLGREILDELSVKIPTAKLSQGYGLTESSGVSFVVRAQQDTLDFGAAGSPLSSVEAKIVDIESGKPLPPTKQGEIWLRGPHIMQGYFNNKEATSNTLDADGWLHTGDLGYINERGLLFIVDRLKELIKYNGYQVPPAELEALLLSNPSILDAAVVPFPDDQAGQIPHGFVVKAPGKQLSEADVIRFIADQVAPFKKLRKVTFVASIPKSPSGKILRRELMEQPTSKL